MFDILTDNNMTIPIDRRRTMMDLVTKKFPIIGWLPLYTWSKLLQDSLAGLTVGLTAIPQGIAYAVLAGLPPQVIYKDKI